MPYSRALPLYTFLSRGVFCLYCETYYMFPSAVWKRTLYRGETRHVLTRVAKCIMVLTAEFSKLETVCNISFFSTILEIAFFLSETVRNRTHVHIHFFFLLRMTNTDLSAWDILSKYWLPHYAFLFVSHTATCPYQRLNLCLWLPVLHGHVFTFSRIAPVICLPKWGWYHLQNRMNEMYQPIDTIHQYLEQFGAYRKATGVR
jgi:hypothetical protein